MIRILLLLATGSIFASTTTTYSKMDYFLWVGWIDRSIWNALEPNQQNYLNDRIVEISSLADRLSDILTELKAMSDQSKIERYKGVDLRELLVQIRRFENENNSLDVKIGELSHIFSKLNSSKQEQINLDFVSDFFRSAKNEFIQQAQDLFFWVREPNGQVTCQQGIATEPLFKKLKHSAEQRKSIRTAISRLRDWTNEGLPKVQSAFQYLYGKISDSDIMSDFFMVRSYLRALHELRLGSLVSAEKSELISQDAFEERLIGNKQVNLTQIFEKRYLQNSLRDQHMNYLKGLFEQPRPHYVDTDNIVGVLNYVTPILQNFQDQISESVLVEEVLH